MLLTVIFKVPFEAENVNELSVADLNRLLALNEAYREVLGNFINRVTVAIQKNREEQASYFAFGYKLAAVTEFSVDIKLYAFVDTCRL